MNWLRSVLGGRPAPSTSTEGQSNRPSLAANLAELSQTGVSGPLRWDEQGLHLFDRVYAADAEARIRVTAEDTGSGWEGGLHVDLGALEIIDHYRVEFTNTGTFPSDLRNALDRRLRPALELLQQHGLKWTLILDTALQDDRALVSWISDAASRAARPRPISVNKGYVRVQWAHVEILDHFAVEYGSPERIERDLHGGVSCRLEAARAWAQARELRLDEHSSVADRLAWLVDGA